MNPRSFIFVLDLQLAIAARLKPPSAEGLYFHPHDFRDQFGRRLRTPQRIFGQHAMHEFGHPRRHVRRDAAKIQRGVCLCATAICWRVSASSGNRPANS